MMFSGRVYINPPRTWFLNSSVIYNRYSFYNSTAYFYDVQQRSSITDKVVTYNIYAGIPVGNDALVKAGDHSKRGVLSIEAPRFSVSARTDREAYEEGEVLTLEVDVTSNTNEGEYQVRVSFNDETRLEPVKLTGGKGKALFPDIPVSFRGNSPVACGSL